MKQPTTLSKLKSAYPLWKICLCVAITSMMTVAHAVELSDKDQWMTGIFSPLELDDGWSVSNIKEAGLDTQSLVALTDALVRREFNNIHAVLVEYEGSLIYEYYASITPDGIKGSFGRDTLHPVYSVTKSVTSLLLGISLEKNFEQALSKPIEGGFSNREFTLSEGSSDITLRHVLTMTAGYEWNEMDVNYNSQSNDDNVMQAQLDPIGYVFAKPLRESPGERWYYNGGMSMLLADIIDQSTPLSFLEYADQMLLQPLGITRYGWTGQWESNTLANAGWGLKMTARDLAKIGSLVLHNGQWGEQQIVPSDWIALSGQRLREDLDTWGADGAYGYGLHWWHGRFAANGSPFEAITALGWSGQRIFIVPEKGLSVTVFSSNYDGDWLMPKKILERIVASVKDSQS